MPVSHGLPDEGLKILKRNCRPCASSPDTARHRLTRFAEAAGNTTIRTNATSQQPLERCRAGTTVQDYPRGLRQPTQEDEPMLVLTPTAVAVVTNLTTAAGAEGAGLRISSGNTPPEGGLQVEITPGPAEQDQVLSERGARVFLDPDAASYLDDKVLDANVDDQGGPHFMLTGQNPDGDSPTA